MAMRFNHMELTLPKGHMDDAFCADVRRFYGEVFGWNALDVNVVGKHNLLLQIDEDTSHFILLAESSKPISAPGYDHLGVLLDTRAEVDELLARCKKEQERDARVEIREYDDLLQGDVTVRAFYVRHLLPIFLDVQCMEWKPGTGPGRRWTFA